MATSRPGAKAGATARTKTRHRAARKESALPKRRSRAPRATLRSGDLVELADRLRDFYGPQSWWPAGSEMEMVFGALLVQNTAWTGARKALDNLIGAELLNPAAIHATPEATVAELIRPSGYFNSKARKLKAFAAMVMNETGGSLEELLRRPLNELRPLLLGTYGFGPETADSVCLYAARHPAFVIDAYTRRLLTRLDWLNDTPSYNVLREAFMSAVEPDTESYAEYHALVITHMKHTCKKRPVCGECPLLDLCPTGQSELGLAPGAVKAVPARRDPAGPPLDWND